MLIKFFTLSAFLVASQLQAAKVAPPPKPLNYSESDEESARPGPPPKATKHDEDQRAEFELKWEVTGALGYAQLGNVSAQTINTSKIDIEFEAAKYFKVLGGFHMGPKAHYSVSTGGIEDFSQFGGFVMAQQLIALAPKGDLYSRHLLLGGGIGYMASTLFYDLSIPTIIIPMRAFQSWTAPALRLEAHYRHFFGGLTYFMPGAAGETAIKLSVGMGIY